MEVHHIRKESEGGDNIPKNTIPLCFDCHADMRSHDHKHPKGNKYSESELKRHRDNWYEKVKGNIGIASRKEVVETDKHVYLHLVRTLPWNGSIDFIRTNNFAGWSFEKSRLNDLHEFEYQCRNPALEFIDPDLEGLRATLLCQISDFTMMIAIETFPTDNVEWNSVPEEWESEQPERFQRVITKLHSTAQTIIETYENLIRTATRKLGVLPDNRAQESNLE